MPSPKILIIEDESTVKKALQKALRHEGYELLFAENGKQGLDILKKEAPSVIFLDLRMPVMDGIDFLKKIKISPNDPYKVVVITGHGDEKDIEECYALGVSNFLRKPLSMTEICCLAKRCIWLKEIEGEIEEHRNNLQKLVDKQTKEIQDQLAFQQSLMDSIPAPIYFKDKKLNLIGCNNSFLNFFGTNKKKATGKSLADFISKALAKKDKSTDEKLLKDQKPINYKAKQIDNDGNQHDLMFYKAVIKDAKNKVTGVIGTIFDFTELEKAHAKIAEKTAALNHANMSLRIMIKQLSDAQSEERVNSNMPNLKELVLPGKDQLEAILDSPSERAYIENIMLNLNRVTSSFAKNLSKMGLGLSPKEIQIADLIRIGLSNKESALQMNVTKSTVEFHRDNLRNKLGLKHKKKNLRSYLMSLDASMQDK